MFQVDTHLRLFVFELESLIRAYVLAGRRCLRFTYSEKAGERIGRECHRCSDGAFCAGGSHFAALTGFWRDLNNSGNGANDTYRQGQEELTASEISKRHTFLPCREKSACLGAKDFGLSAAPDSKDFYATLVLPANRDTDPHIELNTGVSKHNAMGNVRPGMLLNFGDVLLQVAVRAQVQCSLMESMARFARNFAHVCVVLPGISVTMLSGLSSKNVRMCHGAVVMLVGELGRRTQKIAKPT